MPRSNVREKKNTSEKRQLVEELHAPARRNFPRRRIIVRGYDDLWQADVVEMCSYSRLNKGHKYYILTVIDMLSKYAWAVPLKSKSGNEMSETVAKIIGDDKRCSKNFQTDRGKEFYNASVQKLMKKHSINHYSTYSVMKAKYAWAVPLKRKSGNEMSETIAKIIADAKRCPKKLQTERGKEFYNASVEKLRKKHNMNH